MKMFCQQQGREALEEFRSNMARNTSKTRILIVEDCPADTEILLNEFEEFKAVTEIQIAHNGYEAVEMLKANSYDLMFLDIKLNGFSGLDVLIECARLLIRVPVIVLSGAYRDDSDQIKEAWKFNILFAAEKPLRRDQIACILGRA